MSSLCTVTSFSGSVVCAIIALPSSAFISSTVAGGSTAVLLTLSLVQTLLLR